jgi:predicted RecB family nuclease
MITDQAFLSFLNCPRKAFLQEAGRPGERTDIEAVHLDMDALYLQRALEAFLVSRPPSDILRDPASWAAVADAPQVVVNVTLGDGELQAHLHAAERAAVRGGRASPMYAPVLFVRNNRLTRIDKLLVAFQALALSAVQGAVPPVAKIIHGEIAKAVRVKIEPLLADVRRTVHAMRAVLSEPSAPRVTLIGHCGSCPFRVPCRHAAEADDDLSLLRGLPVKELDKQRSRGINTVTQFSYTYQPGRRGKRRAGKARRHDHALQALAVREKKVYVLDSPSILRAGAALYLDVEGLPDQDFYYLIGLLAVRDGVCAEYSYWADDRSQEAVNWQACARVIEGFGEYTLYHYGRYETRFLNRMKRPTDAEGLAAVDRISARACNVLAAIYSHIYFPTYTNGLKDIGTLLGAKWSAANASGTQSVAWRISWEASREEAIKQELLRYNQEDCLALRRVTEFLLSLGDGTTAGPGQSAPAVASAHDLRPDRGFRFGKTEFFCPDLAHINKCAYSDYQREKVYVRTSPALRRKLRRQQRAENKRPRANKEIVCAKPALCPECGASKVHSFGARLWRKVVWDLHFTASGVRRRVVCYCTRRYRCWQCMKTFLPAAYRAADRWGHGLASWAIYQHIALRQSHDDVIHGLREVFGLAFYASFMCRLTPRMAERYRAAYERLRDNLRRGPLIHADETKVDVQRGCGYVWAFTNLEEVVYAYTPTRAGTILHETLDGFTGVLVSDFYSAYDAAECSQQKCLIHLARDINDDIFHSPFDEELKLLAQGLVSVLKPIIDTIDQYGLKRYHLHKHKEDVQRFVRGVSEQAYGSELARHYQRRLQRYRDKLFVFLDHDGVPWNNNNAEIAIKAFAKRRRILRASFAARGLQDYLVFLSLYQTCRNKQLSFLRFLRSGELDLDAFAGANGR